MTTDYSILDSYCSNDLISIEDMRREVIMTGIAFNKRINAKDFLVQKKGGNWIAKEKGDLCTKGENSKKTTKTKSRGGVIVAQAFNLATRWFIVWGLPLIYTKYSDRENKKLLGEASALSERRAEETAAELRQENERLTKRLESNEREWQEQRETLHRFTLAMQQQDQRFNNRRWWEIGLANSQGETGLHIELEKASTFVGSLYGNLFHKIPRMGKTIDSNKNMLAGTALALSIVLFGYMGFQYLGMSRSNGASLEKKEKKALAPTGYDDNFLPDLQDVQSLVNYLCNQYSFLDMIVVFNYEGIMRTDVREIKTILIKYMAMFKRRGSTKSSTKSMKSRRIKSIL